MVYFHPVNLIISAISCLRTYLAGTYVLIIAQKIEVKNTVKNIFVGKAKGIGKSINSALYIAIVYPIIIPTSMPMIQLEKTSVNAS